MFDDAFFRHPATVRQFAQRWEALAASGWTLAFVSSPDVHCEIVHDAHYRELQTGSD